MASSHRLAGRKAVLSVNASWNVVNFRSGLIRGLRREGLEVVVVAPRDSSSPALDRLGVSYIPIEMDNQGTSPPRDLRLLRDYWRILGRIRPDVFLGYTAKPNIYGSLAARSLGIPVINNVAGLGTAFIKRGWMERVVRRLYTHAFRRSSTIFFQNDTDREMFVDAGIVAADRTRLLPGSGIDLSHFRPVPVARGDGAGLRFLLVARLLWDKGVREFVEAARLVKRSRPDAQFQLLGFLDVANRTAIPRAAVDAWVQEGVVDYLGTADDVRPAMAAADCVVLPSYREGLPRVLLEAGAMAKPVIATDVPGCHHVVDEGVNGLLCAVRDPVSLSQAMLRMIALSGRERAAMGYAGREMVENRFDEKLVVERYLEAIEQAVAGR
jgi:glycosyltransferase involved in cell wall biosynthesis